MWKVWWGRGGWSWESNKSGVNIVSWSQHEGENKTRWYGVVTYHVLTYHGYGGLDGIVWYGMVKGYGRVGGTKQASSCNNSPPTPCHDYHTYHLLFCDDWWLWLWFWYLLYMVIRIWMETYYGIMRLEDVLLLKIFEIFMFIFSLIVLIFLPRQMDQCGFARHQIEEKETKLKLRSQYLAGVFA